MMKKVLCMTMAIVMMFTFTAFCAFAEDETKVQDITTFNGVADTWGSEDTGDALIGYDLAVVGKEKVAYIVDGTKATGNIVIPSSVVYENEYYKVVAVVEGAFVSCRGLNSLMLPSYNAFTVIGLDGTGAITNGVFVDCEPQILVKYNSTSVAVDTYAILTTDTGATYTVYNISEDVDESIFSYVMKIVNMIKAWLFRIFKIGATA